MADDDGFDALMDSYQRVEYVRESATLNGVMCRRCAFCREHLQDWWCELNEIGIGPDMFCSRFIDKRAEGTNGR